MDQVVDLSYHHPDDVPHRPGHAASRRAGHRRGQPGRARRLRRPGMTDPTLGERLQAVTVPILVVWGESRPDGRPRLRPGLRRRHPRRPVRLLPARATSRSSRPPASCSRRSADAGTRARAQRRSSSQRASLGQTLTASRASARRGPGTSPARMIGEAPVIQGDQFGQDLGAQAAARAGDRVDPRAGRVIAVAAGARAAPRPGGSRSTSRARAAPVRV